MDKHEYILTSDGELYHWKYIKREKVNGKWKYIYDNKGLKNDIKNFVNDPTGTKARDKFQQTYKDLQTAQKVTNRRVHTEGNLRKGWTTSPDKERKWLDIVEDAKQAFDDEGRALDNFVRARSTYEKRLLGKLDKAVSKGEAKVKDWLGYDEKEKLRSVNEKAENLSKTKRELIDRVEKGRDELSKKSHTRDEPDKLIDTVEFKDAFVNSVNEELKKQKQEAEEAFMNTPLGKLEKMSESFKSAKEWISNMFDDYKTADAYKDAEKEANRAEEVERKAVVNGVKAQKKLDDAVKKYDQAKTAIADADKKVTDMLKDYNSTKHVEMIEPYKRKAVVEAYEERDHLNKELLKHEKEVEKARKAVKEAREKYESAKTNRETAERDLEVAKEEYDRLIRKK